jgi:aldehyde dehydrogenase (NAD+)
MKQITKNYINGEWVPSSGTEDFKLISPVTEELIGTVRLSTKEDLDKAVAAAKKAFKTFSQSTLAQRAEYLTKLGTSMKARRQELIDVTTLEYGGIYPMAVGTVDRAIRYMDDARQVMERFPFIERRGQADVVQKPLGVVGIITPWNASHGFIAGKLAMAIASGSTAVIKGSEMSALQVQLLIECFHAAGLPPGIFNVVHGSGDVVGAALVQHPDVAKITFTGSSAVGKSIARDGAATMKRVTLELGGKSPNILLDDADLENALPLAVMGAVMNSGQACIAATRLIVPESKLEQVKAGLIKAMGNLKVGDPANPENNVGPLVNKKQYDRVQSYIRKGVAEGAEILVGGEGHPEKIDRGYFVRPTVFVNVKNSMAIAQEEIFGPVLSVISYKTEEEAIEIANDTIYGLHGYVSGGNLERAHKVASQIIAGRVYVNGFFEPHDAPFGGFKQSGLGREVGIEGLAAYLEPQVLMGHRE